MGLWDTPLPEPKKQPASAAPNQPVDTETHLLDIVKDNAKGVGKDIAVGVNNGFWNFMGNVVEAAKAAGKEPLPYTAGRLLLGTELIDGISPYNKALQHADQEAALQGKLKPKDKSIFSKEGIVDRFTPQGHEYNGPFSEVVSKGFEMASDPSNLVGGPMGVSTKALAKSAPTLAKAQRPMLAAGFAGAGAETGKLAGGPIAATIMGEEARDEGEAAGSLVGAVVGGNIQDFRGQAIVNLGKRSWDTTRAAVATARDMARTKSVKDARAIFNDNYGDISAKSQGILKDYVRAAIAVELSKDPQVAAKWQEFDDAVKATGGPDLGEQWTVAQRSDNPVLVAEEKYRVPLSGSEAVEREVRHRSTTEGGVVRRFNSLFKGIIPPTKTQLSESLDDLARETNLKLDVLATEQAEVVRNMTHWDSPGAPKTADKGAELRALADTELAKTKTVARANYDEALGLGDELGVEIPPAKLRASTQDIMGTLLAQLKGNTVPGSVRKLGDILAPETRAEHGRIAQLEDTLRTTTDEPTKLKVRREIAEAKKALKESSDANLTLRDVNDISVALNKDASTIAASGMEGAAIAARNVRQLQEALENSITGAVPDVVRQKLLEARRYYAEVHGPRKEGANTLTQRQAGGSRPGEERIVDEEMFKVYLDPNKLETRMREFDNLFSGQVGNQQFGPINEKAYKLLGEAIENQYHKDFLSKGKLDPKDHEAFLRKWNSALERVPGTRERLEDSFNMVSAFERDKQVIEQKYNDVANHDLTKTFGPDKAKQVLEKALSDPNQMGRLVNYTLETQGRKGLEPLIKYVFDNANPMAGGEYKAGTIQKLLNLGKAADDRIGGMQVLFRRAFGEQAGDKHYATLEQLATLQARADATKPERQVASATTKGPMEQAMGQSAASMYTTANAYAQGRVSGVWSALASAGRFSNAKFGAAWRQLQNEAMYQPDAAEAIVAMMKANQSDAFPTNSALALARRMGADGKGFLQRLVDIGAIGPVTYQGVRIGTKESTQTEEESR